MLRSRAGHPRRKGSATVRSTIQYDPEPKDEEKGKDDFWSGGGL